jgi:hypothetical protein
VCKICHCGHQGIIPTVVLFVAHAFVLLLGMNGENLIQIAPGEFSQIVKKRLSFWEVGALALVVFGRFSGCCARGA